MNYNLSQSLIEAARSVLEKPREIALYESILLLEDRIQFLKDNNPQIDTSHDTFAQHKDAGDIIDHFAAHDPSRSKQYTQWMVGQYKKKNFRQEDLGRVQTALSNFDRYKGKLAQKDVNQYAHLSDLENAVEPHLGTAASKKEEIRQVKEEGAELVHSENGLTVHKLKTHDAACRYGANTKWCTASAHSSHMFDTYSKQGPLYVIQRNGVKHQLHFESNQYMDAEDKPINLKKFVDENPELKNVKEFKDAHPLFNEPHEVAERVASYSSPSFVRNAFESGVKLPEHAVISAVQKAAEQHSTDATDRSHASALSSLAKYAHAPTAAIDTAIKSLSKEKYWNKTDFADHPNLSEESALMLAKSSSSIAGQIARNPAGVRGNLPHALYAMKEDKESIHANLAANPNLPHTIAEKIAANDRNHHARANLFMNPATSKELISKHADDVRLHSAISTNPNAPGDVLVKVFKANRNNEWIHENLAKNKATPVDLLRTLSDHPSDSVANAATKTLKSLKVK